MTITLSIKTCKQFGSSCKTTINSLRPYITIGDRDIDEHNSLTQLLIKMKLGMRMLFNEHTTIITVNIVVNNVVLLNNKEPQVIHLAISELEGEDLVK